MKWILVILAAFLAACSEPQDYDDCVITKMEGQDGSVLFNAQNYCLRKFPREELINKSKVGFLLFRSGRDFRLSIYENESGYNITKVKMGLPKVSCDQISEKYEPAYYDKAKEYKFDTDRGIIEGSLPEQLADIWPDSSAAYQTEGPVLSNNCMKIYEVYGVKNKE